MQFICKKTFKKPVLILLAAFLVLGALPPFQGTLLAAAANTVKVVQIAAGENNSIALKSDGTVIAWGNQVTSWAKPPEGLKDVVEIYAKDTTFLARKSNGTMVAWGGNEAGETNVPAGLQNVISMAAAGHHTMAVAETSIVGGAGTVYAWGLNGNGQVVVPTAAKSGIKKVAAGTYYSMALKFTGTIVDWGSNGTGATSMPAGLSNVVDIDAGYMYALALKSDGTVVAWGQEYAGNRILNVAGLTDVIAISANREYALALKEDGTVVGWGDNQYGRATPPAGLKDVVAISAGVNHSLALKEDGTVVSWGSQTNVPGDDNLSGLTITEGEPDTAFSSSVTEYHYNIDPGTSSVHIKATLQDSAYSALYINDQLQTSGSTVAVSIPTTGAEIEVRVEPYMKPPKTYTLTISRDREPPVIDISPNGSSTAPVRSINTVVAVTDATSGLKASTLEYVWSKYASAPADTDGWTHLNLLDSRYAVLSYTGVDGEWYLHVKGQDNAGNWANATSDPFMIDNTPPKVDLTVLTDDALPVDPGDNWTNRKITVTAVPTDAQSSVVSTVYSLDSGKTWEPYTGAFTLTDDGIYVVVVQATDTIGNVGGATRTIYISHGTLTLTTTFKKVVAYETYLPYTLGEWSNFTVQVSAVADAGAFGPAAMTYELVYHDPIDDVDKHESDNYGGQPIGFLHDGHNIITFHATDGVVPPNTISIPLVVNIDKKAPTVVFTPDGNSTSERETSVIAAVYDSGSGVVESTLEYVWTQQPTDIPTDGWQQLNNGGKLTKEGVSGEWYLRVRGKDVAGNEMNVRSNVFKLKHSSLNSLISQNTADFDKNVAAQTDVMTTLSLNGNTLIGISNGSYELKPDKDYTVSGNTAIINKSYLAAQPVGTTSLTFTFSGGADQKLTVTISDTTPPNSAISPDLVSFDQKTSAQADIIATMTLNNNTFVGISNGGNPLVSGTHYTLAGNTVTILRSYLAAQPLGITSLTFTFSSGVDQALIVMVSDSTLLGNTITYSGNGSTEGTVPTDIGVYPEGTAVPLYGNVGNLKKSGYTFAGWNTQADGNGTNYAAGQNFLMGSADVTLYAKWEADSGNGNGDGDGGSTAPPTEPGDEDGSTGQPPVEQPPIDPQPTIVPRDIAGHWAEAYIKQAISLGIISGYPDGTFKPNRTVTRAEFTVMLMNTLKQPGEETALTTFTDMAKIGSWAQKAVAQAVQTGIISGYEDGSFRPDAEITRAEMAMMLANASRLSLEANVVTGFADDRDIPAWAKGAVSALKKLGLIQGKGSNEFDPNVGTTRAEAVTVLMRMQAQKS